MQEWLNWLVSKTSEPAMVPRVRIPVSPPIITPAFMTGFVIVASVLLKLQHGTKYIHPHY